MGRLCWRMRTAAMAAALLGCQAMAWAGTPATPKTNVVLIILDQLQADRLHSYGNPRPTSPNIDRLAERGVRFSHFYTAASWTAPSYATVMTSLYPSRHGVTLFWRPGMPLIDPKVPVLAEVFKANGYETAAFVNNGLAGKQLTGRGFDEYYEGQPRAYVLNITERRAGPAENTAPGTLPRLLPWLDRHRSRPFFLFVLFMEPHSPYDPPPEHDLFKSDAYPGQSDTGFDLRQGHLKRLAMLGDEQAIERLYQLYDGKIHFIDSYVGQLTDHLGKLGLDKKTLIVLTSDHGELLYSHPRDYLTFDHRSLYDAVMHVPFILAGPRLPRDRVVNALASNLDTAPTILDLAQLPPLSDAQGRSLMPLVRGKAGSVNDYVFGEQDVAIPSRSVRTGRYKLVRNLWTGQEQLFDLQSDPQEQTDVAQQNPAVLTVLDARLKAWMRENQPSREEQLARWRIYTKPETVQVVDDQTIGGRLLLTGSGWHTEEYPPVNDYFGGGCFWTEGGDGSRSAVWRVDNPLLGAYRVSVYYGHLAEPNLASNAKFTIVTETGPTTVAVDFNHGAGQWHSLGVFDNPRFVSLSNAAGGDIIVDAVKFERVASGLPAGP